MVVIGRFLERFSQIIPRFRPLLSPIAGESAIKSGIKYRYIICRYLNAPFASLVSRAPVRITGAAGLTGVTLIAGSVVLCASSTKIYGTFPAIVDLTILIF